MERDIWQQLYEFPMIETSREINLKTILQQAEMKNWLQKKSYEIISISPLFKQQLSHQLIAGQFISIKLNEKVKSKNDSKVSDNQYNDWLWIARNKVSQYAFPGIVNQYLNKKVAAKLINV